MDVRHFGLPLTLTMVLSACGTDEPTSPAEPMSNPLCERAAEQPQCVPEDFGECSDMATPNFSTQLAEPAFFRAEPPYDNPDCTGRYLYEVATEGFVPSAPEPIQPWQLPVWLLTVWDITEIDTPEKCAKIAVDVAIQRELSAGTWQAWDDFRVVGDWTYLEACETVFCGGGRLPDGTLNDRTGAPWTWVDIEATRRVRVVVSAHDEACVQQRVLLAVHETAD
jgi:hypothetical protein